MQVDMNMNMNSKWASAGRVPPLDLSGVTVCPRETKRQWHQLNNNNHNDTDTDVEHHLRHGDADANAEQMSHNHHHRHHHHHLYQQQHNQHHNSHHIQTEQMIDFDLVHGADGLPIDPRDWTRADVWSWLTNLAMSEGLQPTGDLVLKFPMNGKALCLMSLDMYLARVPHGGKMLYRDFRVRLARAMNL